MVVRSCIWKHIKVGPCIPLFQAETIYPVYSFAYSNMKTATLVLLSTLNAASVAGAWGPSPQHYKGKYQPKSPHYWGPPGKPSKWPRPPFQPGFPHGPWGQPEPPGPVEPALVTPVIASYSWRQELTNLDTECTDGSHRA